MQKSEKWYPMLLQRVTKLKEIYRVKNLLNYSNWNWRTNIGQEETHTMLCLLCLEVHKSLPF